ncbi:alpha/beta hydrolase family protein [Sphingomonas sp. S2-65]|uniref:alpha/beta hydrolase family protein n=1 Tax=Sphingomonas sp. S2-65 TaxID=2903960 RepID=UPI001F1F3826|nr:lysophospholipase [Sphingomonas sp. S2-65]UYY58538.1 lysophospholipase [Sphingomonas sp. S2-65]
MRFRLALLPLLLTGCATSTPTMNGRLQAETYGPKRGSDVQTLIVVLQGEDAPDHHGFARSAARTIPGAAAVALVRSGDTDHRSPPDGHGTGAGDDRTRDHLASVGDTITALRVRYPRARTIVVGDAGGAAIAANLAGIRPALIDGMVLVGCPCTLGEWRQRVKQTQDVGSGREGLDPLQTAGGILPSLRAAVLVGADDAVTPIAVSRAYAEALALRGVATDYRILPGRGHDLLNDPEVLAATERLAAAMLKKG